MNSKTLKCSIELWVTAELGDYSLSIVARSNISSVNIKLLISEALKISCCVGPVAASTATKRAFQ